MDDDDHMISIYLRHRDNPQIRWTDSLRRQLDVYWREPDPKSNDLEIETINYGYQLLDDFYGKINSYEDYLIIKKQEKIKEYGL
jgi:hypothetical protein